MAAQPGGVSGEVPDGARMFAPLAWPDPVNAWRSGSGRPGPLFWQNRADYEIRVRIDTVGKVLTGTETITYTNNSPDDLDALWVHLDQNIYREDARASFAAPQRHAEHTGGIVIDAAEVLEGGRGVTVSPEVNDTRMRVPLPRAVAGKGGKVRLRVSWHYTVPGPWGGRTAVTPEKYGDIYEIAQFYPRMAVYDDLRGWDVLPYLGQEFYLEYGDIDYSVTVPSDFIVAGSGALLNPEAVLTAEQRARLARAGKSDTRVMIRTADEVKAAAEAHVQGPEKTWHFRMNRTRDVAFFASRALLWDAARLDLPPLSPAPGRPAEPRLAMSVYPVEGIGSERWDRSTEYVKHSIEYFSKQWFEYPWPDAINAGGHGAAMEYPGIVFDGMDDRDAELFWVTTHELGHDWFPMIVGSNERRHAFMDEGFNTFIDALASEHFNHGEFAPKKDGEYAPQTGRPAEDILKVLRDPSAPVLMDTVESVPETWRHPVTYFKGAYGLTLLREQILGPARFDPAFRRYIATWAFRHPTPSDFFRFMNSETGEDLSWFWRGWYFENHAPDYALRKVVSGKDEARVTVANRGLLPLPVDLEVTWADGRHVRLRIPAQTWEHQQEVELRVPGGGQVRSAVLDPDHVIPLSDRSDDSFTAP
ncbi:M1 family metallopeptidase [Acetobacter sp. AN02]|nr:M1 family metallopeptidase [Acetobacter sp. AN02]MDG6094047.1 M1 family metallopeptidase [Acetobacter sp. AN02]